MSNKISSDKIQNNPKYHELISKRDTTAWLLSALVLFMYFGFVLMVALAPEILTQPIASDSVIPLGMPIGVGVILGSIILTGIYVYRANTTFDDLNNEIIKDATK